MNTKNTLLTLFTLLILIMGVGFGYNFITYSGKEFFNAVFNNFIGFCGGFIWGLIFTIKEMVQKDLVKS